CVREVFLREPGTLTPCTNHAGGIGRRHDLRGRGVRVVLPAHETAGLSRHTSFSRTLLGVVGARPNVAAHALIATAPATFQSPRDWRKIAQVRNDPKRGARLQGAAPASTNRGVTRTDPAESRQAPIAERERRPLQAPALRTPIPSGTSCILLTSSLPAGGGPTRSHRNAKRATG